MFNAGLINGFVFLKYIEDKNKAKEASVKPSTFMYTIKDIKHFLSREKVFFLIKLVYLLNGF